MRVRVVSVVAMLLAVFSAGAPAAQTQGRVFVVLIDAASYRPSEFEGAGQLLGVLRDQVLQPADLVSLVSTGRSSVPANPSFASDRSRLSEAIRRMVNASPSVAVAPTVAGVGMVQLEIERQAQMAFRTTFRTLTDIVDQLEMVDKRAKHLLLLTSAATSAAVLRAALSPPNDMMRDLASVAEEASRAGVTIHVIDPADPVSRNVVRRLN
jgi:hypothetical protein